MTDISHIVIGAGRMGGAMIKGWTTGRSPKVPINQLLIIDPNPGEDAQRAIDAGARHEDTLPQGLDHVAYVLLAIKPQMFAEHARAIASMLPSGAVVISILAGIPLPNLQEMFPAQRVVRAMPNTPASIGKGITAYVAEASVEPAQKRMVERLLKSGGQVAEVDGDAAIDMVTAVSGSGPAYFFHMVEALAAAGAKIGLPEDLAIQLARQTLIGSGALVEASDRSASELRQAVTSPNGTTQAALDVLMSERGLPPIMRDTVQAAFKRAKELGK